MRKIASILMAAVFVFGASVVCMAGHRGINARQYREQQRIYRGIRSGELTRREAWRLQSGLNNIRRYERFARSDGHLSASERARLQHQLNRESRAIRRQTHDRHDRNR